MRQSRDFSGAGRAVVVVAVAAVVEDSAFDGPVKLALLDMMPVVAAVADWDSSELIPLLLVVFESFDVAVAVVVGDVLVVVGVLYLFVSIRVRGQYV